MSIRDSSGIPQVPRFKAFLDSGRMKNNPVNIFWEYNKILGKTFSFHFGGLKKAVVTTDADLIQYILKDHYENYQKSEIEMKRMVHFLGKGLLTTHGKYWLTQRRLIQQGFHKNQLAAMTQGMHGIMNDSLEKLEQSNGGYINIHQYMNEITFRMVMQSLFTMQLKPEELEFIGSTISRVQGFLVKQIVQPYLNSWFRISGELKKHDSLRYGSDRIIHDYIKKRKDEGVKYDDLLQILMDSRYADTGEGMTDSQILAESIQLIVAGHETTSTALSWILFLLHEHPDALENIRDEISRVLGDAPLQYSDVPKFEYTGQVIDEALRLYPPFWMVDRVAVEDDEFAGLRIRKGTTLIAFIYGIHHSGDYWDEPEIFNPERFTKENVKNRHSFAHIPFGGGPKGCIGGNYANLQMLVILTHLLANYDFEMDPSRTVEPKPMLILRPKDGIFLRFRKRGMKEKELYRRIVNA